MKKVILAAFVAFVAISAEARDKTPSGSLCYVRDGASFLGFSVGQVIEGNKFFSAVYQQSRRNRCSIGKMYGVSESTRLYVDGRRLGDRNDGMSNSETEAELRYLGLRPSDCVVMSCEMF